MEITNPSLRDRKANLEVPEYSFSSTLWHPVNLGPAGVSSGTVSTVTTFGAPSTSGSSMIADEATTKINLDELFSKGAIKIETE